MTIRQPAVAGRFYPAGPHVLRNLIDLQLREVELPAEESPARGYVVPHAGYRFSGPIAARVFARLRRDAATIRRVVLVGPSHRVRLRGFAASPDEHWRTPLGTVDVVGTDVVPVDARPHELEHSLEVQVPFLQVVLPGVPITPVVIGVTETESAGRLIDELVDEGGVLLCSTDLSHYLRHEEAVTRDRATADNILALAPQRIHSGDACGLFPLRGTLEWARHHGLTPTELDLRTSADTFGDADRVVGYSAFSFV